MLDGEGSGPVSHLCVPSRVAEGYAPPGRHLVSATVIGRWAGSDAELERAARAQLTGWFGEAVARWSLLRIYRIDEALPAFLPPTDGRRAQEPRLGSGVFVCGDHRELPSLNGAMASGRRAADAVWESLR